MPEITHLPLPTKLTPIKSKNTLMISVRIYFYKLYNDTEDHFRKFLVSVSNKDSITGRQSWDRHEAVKQIVKAANEDKNQDIMNAIPTDIYKCMAKLMVTHGLSLKSRRQQYNQLIAPAE